MKVVFLFVRNSPKSLSTNLFLQFPQAAGTQTIGVVVLQIGARHIAQPDTCALAHSGRVVHADKSAAAAGTLLDYAGSGRHL